ncbi:hypothetical protein QJS10_CPB19g00164 [Acorus calamus]|uniref:Rhomboid-like protein n=1 Tax=Acorus calamus TaxID=4465 RepID=A0AAV9CFJ0_ACOCL|nr:hypothetical protein QJS10_CPB19g00164 [Acorus calamus]
MQLKSLVVLALVLLTNFIVGLMPYIDNFSNIGGFLSGILLGYAILFDPRLVIRDRKKGLFDYGFKNSSNLKQKLDGPVSRIIAMGLLTLIAAGGFIAVLHGVNANLLCSWCHYINCMPTKLWPCNEKSIPCEAMVSEGRLILTCNSNDNFRMNPFANISIGRILICAMKYAPKIDLYITLFESTLLASARFIRDYPGRGGPRIEKGRARGGSRGGIRHPNGG